MSDVSGDGLFLGPCAPATEWASMWTDEQVEQFAAEWRRKMQDGTFGRPVPLTPLPLRVRLRLAVEQAVTGAGIWLCDHKMWWAAGLLWWRR